MTDLRVPICCACFSPLTSEERNYYESRCEACEEKLLERIDNWRLGHPDLELDRMFSGVGQVR